MDKKTEALKLALESLVDNRHYIVANERTEYLEIYDKAIDAVEKALAEQPAQQQEPVACAVCNEVHTILDTDESKIIRSAADGYPEGRTPRVLTLQERVIALCVYAADWKRWCIEKENASPAQQQELVAWMWKDGTITSDPDRADGTWMPLYTTPPASKPFVGLTDEEIERVCIPLGAAMLSFTEVAQAIEAKLREKNT